MLNWEYETSANFSDDRLNIRESTKTYEEFRIKAD